MEVLDLVELCKLMVSSIPVGFLLGFMPALVGLAIWGMVKIFKRV